MLLALYPLEDRLFEVAAEDPTRSWILVIAALGLGAIGAVVLVIDEFP